MKPMSNSLFRFVFTLMERRQKLVHGPAQIVEDSLPFRDDLRQRLRARGGSRSLPVAFGLDAKRDVEVGLVGSDRVPRHDPGEARDVLERLVSLQDFPDGLRLQGSSAPARGSIR